MKILLTILASLVAIVSSESMANPINFKLNPFSLVADSVNGSVDVGLNNSGNFALGGEASYVYDTKLLTGLKGAAYSGSLRISYFTDGMLEDSFFTAASLGQSYLNLRNIENKQVIVRANTGDIRAGYRWLWPESGFNAQLGAGVGQVRASSNHINTRGLVPVAELSFGIQTS